MDFVVDRKKRARGGKNGAPMLLNGDGYQCCLGFCVEQIGYPKECMLEVGEPSELDEESVDAELFELEDRAIQINDDQKMDDVTREAKLAELFENHGHTISFRN